MGRHSKAHTSPPPTRFSSHNSFSSHTHLGTSSLSDDPCSCSIQFPICSLCGSSHLVFLWRAVFPNVFFLSFLNASTIVVNMDTYRVLAGVALSSTAVALAVALRKIFNPEFEFGGPPCKQEQEDQRNPLVMLCRWFSAPVAAVSTAFCVALRPGLFQSALPSVFSSYAGSLHKVLPLHPRDLMEAFQLGAAYRALVHEGNTTGALATAESIAKRTVSEDELRRLPQVIAELLAHQGLVSRVLSAFSIVNIVWFVAILGLTATVGPFVYTVLKPIRKLLHRLSQAALKLLIRLAKRVSPLAELALYATSLYVLVESSRYALGGGMDPYGMVGPMTAVSSVALLGVSWGCTTAFNSNKSGNMETFMVITWTLASLYCIPAAQMHQSTLLGYGAVAAASAALGFSAFSYGLMTFLGFKSQESLIRGAIGCGSMTAAAFIIKGAGLQNSWTAPLVGPLSVFGTSIYLLALDINAFHMRNVAGHAFYVANLIMIVGGGHMIGLEGAANVAKSFGGLFLFTLYCTIRPRSRELFTVWIFSLFAILYGGSLYVSRNPEIMAAVLSGGRL